METRLLAVTLAAAFLAACSSPATPIEAYAVSGTLHWRTCPSGTPSTDACVDHSRALSRDAAQSLFHQAMTAPHSGSAVCMAYPLGGWPWVDIQVSDGATMKVQYDCGAVHITWRNDTWTAELHDLPSPGPG